MAGLRIEAKKYRLNCSHQMVLQRASSSEGGQIAITYQPFIWSKENGHAGVDLADGQGDEHLGRWNTTRMQLGISMLGIGRMRFDVAWWFSRC